MKKANVEKMPSDQQLEREIRRTKIKGHRRSGFLRLVSFLLTMSAIAVLAAVFWFPVYRIAGNSMEPLLSQGDVVVTSRLAEPAYGDVTALYYENKTLIRRIIGLPGDWINIDKEGKVSVNGITLEENNLEDSVFGKTDLTYPYQVPEGCYFVLGDHRAVSADSRLSSIGCIARDKIAGKVIFRIWPVQDMGRIG